MFKSKYLNGIPGRFPFASYHLSQQEHGKARVVNFQKNLGFTRDQAREYHDIVVQTEGEIWMVPG